MRVQVIKEVRQSDLALSTDTTNGEGWQLCFQRCRYVYDDGKLEEGFRFIWRTPEGKLQPARGQARIPSIELAKCFMDRALTEGWGEGDLV